MRRRFGPCLSAFALVATMAAPAHAADPLEPQQWNLAITGATTARATGTGAGARIAVIDSGVHLGHEDLKDKIDPGYDFVNDDAIAQDDNGHGTHVAGIAAAVTGNPVGVGSVAPGARIVPVKVLSASNSGTFEDVEAGIRWATQQRVDVINLSLGGNAVVTEVLGSDLTDSINDAFAAGIVVVIASGNDSLPISGYGQLNAIVVSATTRADTAATRYSNGVGSAKWGLAAPGGDGSRTADQDIISTYWFADRPSATNGYGALAGTSMATPHVAGAAAVLRKLGLSAQQTVDRLLATAKDLGAKGRDSTYGSGRLDLARAVQGLGSPSSSPAPAGASPTTAAPASRTSPTTRRSITSPATGSSGGAASTEQTPSGEAAGETDPLVMPAEPTDAASTTDTPLASGGASKADVAELIEPPSPRVSSGAAGAAGVLLLAVIIMVLPRAVTAARTLRSSR